MSEPTKYRGIVVTMTEDDYAVLAREGRDNSVSPEELAAWLLAKWAVEREELRRRAAEVIP